MFNGHRFVKIDGQWVFDLTECVGYFVEVADGGNVVKYSRKYKVNLEQGNVEAVQGVPDNVIFAQVNIVNKYLSLQMA